LFTSGGNLQYVETPTTWFPNPSAKSVSVMLGDVDTMRAGGREACGVFAYVVSAFRRTEASAFTQTTAATTLKQTNATHQRFIR
jgi:hypothetical protein